jgi:hypothetical protein
MPGLAVGVGLTVAVGVTVVVALGVAVDVAVAVGVNMGVTVAVAVGVVVNVAVAVGVGLAGVGVDVGDAHGVPCPWQKLIFTVSTRHPSLKPLVSLPIRQRRLIPGGPYGGKSSTVVMKPSELPLHA